MRLFTWRCVLVVLAVILPQTARPASAQVVVKLATLVPEGSSWHLILKETAERWKAISGARVTLKIFPGGVAGDDPEVVTKMRRGALQAAVLTAAGVAEIDRSIYALSVPMMYSTYEEVDYVLEKMRPRLEASMASRGFVVLNWADGGWVYFFAQKPVAAPEDLKALKLFSWTGERDALEVWRSAGFNPVVVPSGDLPKALDTGDVTAFPSPPKVAVLSQSYRNAKNMTDLRWQLVLNSTLITRETWEKVPAEIRPALMNASREAGQRLQDETRKSAAKDIEAMKARGLQVVPVNAKTREAWLRTAESAYSHIRGPIVPAEAFDEAVRHRDEFRSRTPSGH